MEALYRKLDFMGYPCYKIGTDGSVWSRRSHSRKLRKEWTRLWGNTNSGGYRIYALRNSKGVKFFQAGRLVLLAFIGPCPKGKECCHRDGNPRNNKLKNVRWGTRLSNMQDKIRHGTSLQGESHNLAKLSELEVKEIRRRYRTENIRQCELAIDYCVSYQTIYDIVARRTWRHV